jgi:hypothetical protein
MDHFFDSLMAFLKDLPAILLIGWHFCISALPPAILIVTMGYLIMQIAYLRWKWKNEIKGRKDETP